MTHATNQMLMLSQLGPVERHAGGLHALYVRIEPGTVLSGHQHDQPAIVLIVRGDVHVTEDGVEVHEPAGTVRLSRPGLARTIRSPRGADCLVISCEASHAIARHIVWRGVSKTRSARFVVGPEAHALVLRVENRAASLPDFETLCLAMLTALVREADPRHPAPPWLGRALVLLAETGGQRGGCIIIARDLGIHPVHLARVVRRFTGLSVRDYLRRERILRGSLLLRSSEKPLTRVAYEAGFSDQSHFTREFVRRYGHVPSHDQSMIRPDVVSIQASDFPAVHVGCGTSDENACGDTEWDGEEFSEE